MDTLSFLVTPFVACLLLIVINVYFGIHVIKREIIFIDIALAQIAALGSAVALVIFNAMHPEAAMAHDEENFFTYLFSLGFILLVSLMFTFLKNKVIPVPLEAIIGVTYAVATTGAVIILDKGAGGDVHIHDMLIGSILWVSWHKITHLLVAIVITGLVHLIFRDKFIRLSEEYNSGESTLKNRKFWDFLFYFTFGVVIIEAVNVAGILTVFALLIIPASISAMASESWKAKLWTGWSVSLAVAIISLFVSWNMNVPVSPVIITMLAIILFVAIMLRRILKSRKDNALTSSAGQGIVSRLS